MINNGQDFYMFMCAGVSSFPNASFNPFFCPVSVFAMSASIGLYDLVSLTTLLSFFKNFYSYSTVWSSHPRSVL